MKLRKSLPVAALFTLLGASFSAQAYDADWKRGRLYYRSVCTTCHTAAPIGAISPSTKTKADWTAYILTDKHAKGKEAVSKYVGKAYRDSIKDSNKTAAKFADTPDKELMEDIKAFLLKGAKDGDAPASCS
jgi:mono/diheme cytochrome c family protein